MSDAVQTAEVAARPTRRALRIDWLNVTGITTYHLLALLAFLPWFFSWTGVVLMVLGIYVFGTLGINLCYHRLLTHRGFVCPKWLEQTSSSSRVCSFQDTPARWVADPPPPSRAFRRAAGSAQPAGQLPVGAYRLDPRPLAGHGAHADLFALRQGPHPRPLLQAAGPAGRLYHRPARILGGLLRRRCRRGAGRRRNARRRPCSSALSLLVWGVFVRTVVVWHITWSVNSVTHMWGYQHYETGEDSRNNVLSRPHQQRRGLAQQPPCRSALGPPRPQMVGDRRDLPVAEGSRSPRACPQDRRAGLCAGQRPTPENRAPRPSSAAPSAGRQCGAIRLLPQFMVIERPGTRFAA